MQKLNASSLDDGIIYALENGTDCLQFNRRYCGRMLSIDINYERDKMRRVSASLSIYDGDDWIAESDCILLDLCEGDGEAIAIELRAMLRKIAARMPQMIAMREARRLRAALRNATPENMPVLSVGRAKRI